MKITLLSLWRITAVVGFIGIGSLASAQVTMSTTATGGGKTYLSIDNKAVVTNIDTLFAQLNALSSSAGSLTWGDVLDNGATATQDLDLNGKNATGANRIEADSLEAARAEIMDSLLVRGDADFDGNLLVGEWARALALRADSSLAVSGAASNWNTAALGGSSSATGVNAVAIGGFAAATNTQATAIGSQAAASGVNSVAIGESSSAVGTQSVALGKSASVASSNANVAVGVNASVAAGWGNIAVGGGRLTGSGNPTNNVAIGSSTISSNGAYNTSIGYSSTISGGSTTGALTFGPSSSVSTGYRNMAFGANSASTGGNSNYAFGDWSSVTDGWNSAAFGNNSKVQTNAANAYAFGAHSSVGAFNTANFAYASPARFSNLALFGSYADTTAMAPSSLSHNDWIPTDPLFVVANGASDGARSNTLTILKNGKATFSDNLVVEGIASFASELSVGDTLRAAAPALFADSVAVGGSLSVAQSIHTQGVTGASGTPLALDSDLAITILAGSLPGPFGAVAAGATGEVFIVATDEIDMDSPRVKIEELLQLTPTASYAATPEDGDIWFEQVTPTQANLKIYYNGSWYTIKAIP
jgi:hypothetical protein